MSPVRNDPHGSDLDAWAALESVPLFIIAADHVIWQFSSNNAEDHWPDCVACRSARIGMFRPSAGKVYLLRQEAKPPTWPQASARASGTWARAKRCGHQQRRKGGSRK